MLSFGLSLAGDNSFLLFSWLLISASSSFRALFSATRASISSLALQKHKFVTVLVTALKKALLRFHDNLVWIRIRIRGSMSLTNGS